MTLVNAKRPIWNEEMANQLAAITGQILNEWSNYKISLDECILISGIVLRHKYMGDGYELAREFEEHGITPDTMLTEMLDCVGSERRDIQKEHVKKWVIENNLQLDLNIGDLANCKIARKGIVPGEIVKLYPETLQYGFWYKEVGYKKGEGHAVVNAEEIIS